MNRYRITCRTAAGLSIVEISSEDDALDTLGSFVADTKASRPASGAGALSFRAPPLSFEIREVVTATEDAGLEALGRLEAKRQNRERHEAIAANADMIRDRERPGK